MIVTPHVTKRKTMMVLLMKLLLLVLMKMLTRTMQVTSDGISAARREKGSL